MVRQFIKLSLLSVGQRRCYSVAADNFRSLLQSQLKDIKAQGTFKNERVITSAQKSTISVEGMPKQVLNFCANNYLGLSANEEIASHAKAMLDRYGSGLSSVRFICGMFIVTFLKLKLVLNFNLCRHTNNSQGARTENF